MGKQIDSLQGTLDMLILKAVSLRPLHGYGVQLRIQQISGEQLEIQQARYTQRSIGWNIRVGSPASGGNRTTTARGSSTASLQCGANSIRKPKSGTAWHC